MRQWTSIDSDNGFLPGRRQAIIWTKAGILLIWTYRNKLQWNLNQNLYIFIQENAFENVVRKLEAILSRSRCDKLYMKIGHQFYNRSKSCRATCLCYQALICPSSDWSEHSMKSKLGHSSIQGFPAIWRCRNPFSQWQRSFQRKLRSHWLKFVMSQ